MGRYANKYSDAERQAIVRLIVDEGYQAKDAVGLAAEGIDGLEPFHMPPSTAGGLAARERHRRDRRALIQRERAEPGYADRLAHKVIDIVEREVHPLWEESQRQPLDGHEIDRIIRALRVCIQMRRLLASVPRSHADVEGDAVPNVEAALREKVRRDQEQDKVTEGSSGNDA
jgi:hypothetical protein